MLTTRKERFWMFALLGGYLLALYYWIRSAFALFTDLVLKIG